MLWRLQVHNLGVVRIGLFLRSLPDLQMAVFSLCLYLVFLLYPNLLFLRRHWSYWIRAHPSDLIIIWLIISTTTLFSNKVTFSGGWWGFEFNICVLGGHNSIHNTCIPGVISAFPCSVYSILLKLEVVYIVSECEDLISI